MFVYLNALDDNEMFCGMIILSTKDISGVFTHNNLTVVRAISGGHWTVKETIEELWQMLKLPTLN